MLLTRGYDADYRLWFWLETVILIRDYDTGQRWWYWLERMILTGDYDTDSVSSVTQSCPTLWPHVSQHTRPPCPSPTPGAYTNPCPLSRWCHPAISSSVTPSPPALNPSQHQGLFQWVNSSHEVAKVLEFQLQHQSFQWTPRNDLI